MKYLLMQKIFNVPVCNGVFESRLEIEKFFEDYVGNKDREWTIVEVEDKDLDEKLGKAITGQLNYD